MKALLFTSIFLLALSNATNFYLIQREEPSILNARDWFTEGARSRHRRSPILKGIGQAMSGFDFQGTMKGFRGMLNANMNNMMGFLSSMRSKGLAGLKGKGGGRPRPTYGAPKAPTSSYGAPKAPKAPTSSYGAPSKAPTSSYGAPSKAPTSSYGAPKAPTSSYGAPSKAAAPPQQSYGTPTKAAPPQQSYGSPSASAPIALTQSFGTLSTPQQSYTAPSGVQNILPLAAHSEVIHLQISSNPKSQHQSNLQKLSPALNILQGKPSVQKSLRDSSSLNSIKNVPFGQRNFRKSSYSFN